MYVVGSHLADVELDIAHQAAERANDGLHLDEVRHDARDRHLTGLERPRVAVVSVRDVEAQGVCHICSKSRLVHRPILW
jgi:hypothetical protein